MALAAFEGAARRLTSYSASQSFLQKATHIKDSQQRCYWGHLHGAACTPAVHLQKRCQREVAAQGGQHISSRALAKPVRTSVAPLGGSNSRRSFVPRSVTFGSNVSWVERRSLKCSSRKGANFTICGAAEAPSVNSQTGTDSKVLKVNDIAVPLYNFQKEEGATSLPPLEPGLYLVGTPIGNLEDMTFRALRVLQSADLILAEDTRHSGKLLSYFGIKTPMISFHLHNEQSREVEVLQKLRMGKVVAVISDAGMPGISDPGMELVEKAVEAGIQVIPIPGPSAVITALVASGLPTYEFTFVGFLPPDKGARRKRLASMKESKPTQVMFVGPHKLAACLADAEEMIGPERRCVIAREMTKMFEEFYRGTLGEAAVAFRSPEAVEGVSTKKRRPEQVVRGEVTLLIEGFKKQNEEDITEDDIVKQLHALKARGSSVSDATREIVEASGLRKKKIYRLALDIWKDD